MTAKRSAGGELELWPYPLIDPGADSVVIAAVGRKGTGKSYAGRRMFQEWPAIDRLVIDPAGDADPGEQLRPERIAHPIPASWPQLSEYALDPRERPPFRTLHYVPNLASPTYRDDMDRALGLALWPKAHPVLVWVDEAGQVFPANGTGPHGRVLLQQSRHYRAHVIHCMPRAMGVDPLVIAQADRVLIFDLPNPDDRRRVADLIGWPPARLSAELDETVRRGSRWHLMYVAGEDRGLYRVPPLPEAA